MSNLQGAKGPTPTEAQLNVIALPLQGRHLEVSLCGMLGFERASCIMYTYTFNKIQIHIFIFTVHVHIHIYIYVGTNACIYTYTVCRHKKTKCRYVNIYIYYIVYEIIEIY